MTENLSYICLLPFILGILGFTILATIVLCKIIKDASKED